MHEVTTDAQVREFLRRLKAPAPEVMRAVFTRGGCYALVEILQMAFPDAVAYQSCNRDGKLNGEHVVAQINGRFYDILGERHLFFRPIVFPEMWFKRGGNVLFQTALAKEFYRRMTPTECRKARKWAPVCWDQVVRK